MAKYDVFISCKSEDYKYAENIYDFLVANGINTFLASRELRKMAESEYRRAISQAMKDAHHLIVFASNPEYIESEWVFYEWDMFVNAKLKKRKTGNIVTILKDVSTEDIVMDLWKYESLTYENYQETLLNYVETEESKARLKDIETQRKYEEERQRKIEEEKRRKEQQRKELISLAEDFKKKESNLQIDIAKIRSILKSLGVTHKTCPVCYTESSIEDGFCHTCGWVFSPIEGVNDVEYLLTDSQKAVAHYQQIFNAYSKLSTQDAQTKDFKSKIRVLEEDINTLSEELEYSKLEKEDLIQRVSELDNLISGKDTQISSLTSLVKELSQERTCQEKIHDDNEKEIKRLKVKIEEILHDRDSEVSCLKREINELQNKLLSKGSTAQMAKSQSGVIGSSIISSVPSERKYAIWITFATKDVEEIVKQYNSSFSGFPRNNNGSIKSKTNLLVASFNTQKEAEALKKKLEYKGAKAVIKLNGEVLTSNNDRTQTAKPVQSHSSPKKNSTPGPTVFDNSLHTFGIIIKHCGINKANVAQMLSREYGKTTNSFKNQLEYLPFKTKPSLSRKSAEDLLIRLGLLGVNVELYQN